MMRALVIVVVLLGIAVLAMAAVALFAPRERVAVPPAPAPQDAIMDTMTETTDTLSLSSPVFSEGGAIPQKYTCEGENISPPLVIGGVPEGARTLALIMDDPDVPRDRRPDGLFVHWVRLNIPADTREIAEGTEPAGVAGAGTGGDLGYRGPCPPDREHRYFFKLYALDSALELPEGASKEQVERATQGHVLAEAQLMGVYEKVNK